jgi:hypothetical protein
VKSIRFSGSMRTAPLLAALGAAAVMGAVPAQADSGGSNTEPHDAGGGSISASIEKFGQSICPNLVKPGSSLASTLSELQGNTGLTPTLTGMVAGFVIQTQCPSVMSKLAHGDLSALQLPADGDRSAFTLPGQQPVPSGLDLSALLKGAGH